MNPRIGMLVVWFVLTSIICYGQADPVDSIKIKPNPYYNNINDPKVYPGYIDITNIPVAKAEITIYSLAGEKIRTLTKKEGEDHLLWFLRTENNELIETGLYLVKIKVAGMDEKVIRFYYTDN